MRRSDPGPVSRGRLPTLITVLALAAAVLPSHTGAQNANETRERLAALEREIAELQATLENSRGELSRERAQLERVDLEIQSNARALDDVGKAVEEQNTEVERLDAERAGYLDRLADRQDELADQVLAAWRVSRESRLKLLLNQDDPARVGRLLAYYDLLGREQAEQIEGLRTVLVELESMQQEIDRELAELGSLRADYEAQQAELQAGRSQRLELVAQIERQLDSEEARLNELTRNRRDLETLLERLDDALADIPPDLRTRQHPRQLRGALPMPVNGRVLAAFGQPRAAGVHWQGWLIAAPVGSQVRAIAHGRIAYADWLRGYGLLLIVDHGEGFMSLYGHNESLRVEVGDWVEPDDIISTIGLAPQRQTGLYFELRRDGKAVDPAGWIRR
jgi:septal ring factor EnvC (AmiA/AmiB activator)